MKKIVIRQKGFTLVELHVVIGIIATLTAMATFNFNQSRLRARDVQRKSDVKAIESALELYKNDHAQSFPPIAEVRPQPADIDQSGFLNDALIGGTYTKVAFSDPKETSKKGSWMQYKYEYVNPISYFLYVCMENPSDPIFDSVSDNTGCATGGRLLKVYNP